MWSRCRRRFSATRWYIVEARLRGGDTAARLVAGEFVILLERCSISQARQAAESFRRSVADFHFSWCGQDFSINASVGVVPVDADTPGTVELLSGAAGACINAKVTGRNRVFIAEYNPGDIRDLRGEARWVTRTNKALENNRFRLFRQSIDAVESDGGKPKHFELLLRLETKEGDMVSPYAFLGAAERYNLVTRRPMGDSHGISLVTSFARDNERRGGCTASTSLHNHLSIGIF